MDLKVCLDTCVFIAVLNKEQDAAFCETILNEIDEDRVRGAFFWEIDLALHFGTYL